MPCQRKVCYFKSTDMTLNFCFSSSSGLLLCSHLAKRKKEKNKKNQKKHVCRVDTGSPFFDFLVSCFRYLGHVSCMLIFTPNHSQPSNNIRLLGSHNLLWKRCSPSSQSNRLSTFPFLRRCLQDWSGQCLMKPRRERQAMTSRIHDRRRLEMKSCFQRTTLS